MKIIISPSKDKKIKDYNYSESSPIFLEKANYLVNEIKKLELNQIQAAYKCSQKLAQKVIKDFNEFNKLKHPAISFYNGLQYKYLDVETLKMDEINFIIMNTYIIDALYGVLSPNDLISEYRLDFHTKLSFFNYSYYKKDVNQLINEKVINLCSKEYSSLIDSSKLFNINFLQNKNNIIKSFSTETKIARGLFIRHIAQNKSSDISVLKKFSSSDYILTAEGSNFLTFTKKQHNK